MRGLATFVTLSVAVLTACGGGSTGANNTNTGSTTVPLVGTVATGSPVGSATITVIDATGTSVATGTTLSDGTYAVDVPSTAQAPLVIKADYAGQSLYSVTPSVAPSRVNVNQLTNATVSLLSASGNVGKFVSEVQNGEVTITESSIATKTARLNAAISPIKSAIDSTGGSTVDYMNGSFTADGTGTDKLLDTVQVYVEPATTGNVNTKTTQILFNTANDPETTTQLAAVNFSSQDSLEALTTKAGQVSINPSNLPSNILGSLYRDYIDRFNSCYALPLAQRVTNGILTAPVCKSLFRDSNPDDYLHGGKTAAATFPTMFTVDKTAEFFEQLSPWRIHNIKTANNITSGKAVIGLMAKDEFGNYLNTDGVVEVYYRDGNPTLGLIGDQNPVAFTVGTTISATEHPLAQDKLANYVASMYSIYLPVYEPTGKTLKKAIVTSPTGKTIILGKKGSRSQLFICKSIELDVNSDPTGNCTSTPDIYMAFRYTDENLFLAQKSPYQSSVIRGWMAYAKSTTNTNCPEVSYDYNGTTVNPGCPLTDDEIEAQVPGGLWTAKFVFTDGTNSSTLKTRHAARALSNRELISSKGPDKVAASFTQDTVSYWKGLNEIAVQTGRAPDWWLSLTPQGYQMPVWSPAAGGYEFNWSVEAGQKAPRRIYVSGKVAYYGDVNAQMWNSNYRIDYDEMKYFPSTSRSTTLTCSLSGSSDISCGGVSGDWIDSQTPLTNINQDNANTNFADGAYIHYAQLWTFDENGRNLKREYNLYTP